jgi:choice-of-anchor A domain-containing protein
MRAVAVAVAVLLTSALAVAVALGTAGPRIAQAPADSDCMTSPLGPVPDANINIVVQNDLNLKYTDSEGRIVVGRDATLEGFGIASALPVDRSRVDIAVGRDLEAWNSGLNRGSGTYGRNLIGNLTAPNGTITQKPFDITSYFAVMTIRSKAWAALTPVEDGVSGSDVLTFTGTDPVRNVFTVSAARLGAARTIRIHVPLGATPAQAPTTLINVTGGPYSAAGTNATEFWDGDSYEQIGHPTAPANLEALRVRTVWNFPDAADVTLGGSMAWQGTILAPHAVARLSWQQVNGPVIVSYLYGNGETHLHRPVPFLPDPTPFPPNPP